MAGKLRRIARRRVDERKELVAWSSAFESGVALDGDLEDFGLGQPTDAQIEEAWHRIGAAYIEAFGPNKSDDTECPLWALRQFGEP